MYMYIYIYVYMYAIYVYSISIYIYTVSENRPRQTPPFLGSKSPEHTHPPFFFFHPHAPTFFLFSIF